MPIVVDETEPVGGDIIVQINRVNPFFKYIFCEIFIEIEPPFESRDVQIKRGLNVRDFFDMEEEIGRYCLLNTWPHEQRIYLTFFSVSFAFVAAVRAHRDHDQKRQVRHRVQMPRKEHRAPSGGQIRSGGEESRPRQRRARGGHHEIVAQLAAHPAVRRLRRRQKGDLSPARIASFPYFSVPTFIYH